MARWRRAGQQPAFDFPASHGAPDRAVLNGAIRQGAAALMALQKPDGHWCFPLEADATIPAEYIMLMHYLDEVDAPLQARIAHELRRLQADDHGGWPLFRDGPIDISATVKAYFALKLAGDSPDAPHMARARAAILNLGGAARANVFTRIALSLFGQVPWRAVPVLPIEIMILPRWFPFHLNKVSYWSRTVIVPLLVLTALKPRAKNPQGVSIAELFVTPPFEEKNYLRPAAPNLVATAFDWMDRALRLVEPFFPRAGRAIALERAVAWFEERLNGLDGLGAIFPAMANSVMAMEALGYAKDDERLVTAKESLRRLIVEDEAGNLIVQPCVSPIWDTGLVAHALLEAAQATENHDDARVLRDRVSHAHRWLAERQILDVAGDWIEARPGVRPGGWAFQYANPHYPDVDDTAVVGLALDRDGDPAFRGNIARAVEWIVGLQSKNGGWGAFDADNNYSYLNCIPFADHGALLDPPTVDVSARCVSFLVQAGMSRDTPVIQRAIAYLWAEQEEDGSWFGRWGTNYIYGTWSALCALNAAGEPHDAPGYARAIAYLVGGQRADGGWGEDGTSYYAGHESEGTESTASQTAWAVLGLMAAGQAEHEAVARGIAYLLRTRRADGLWDEERFTSVGFPRVFYLRYHGYRAHFPVMALARYANMMASQSKQVLHGL